MNAVAETREEAPSGEVRQWVTFQLNSQDYGMPVEAVQEVLRVPEIAPVPGAPDYMLGVMNLRGNIVAVIDGRHRFGMAPAAVGERGRVIVLRLDECICGVEVDCVTDVVNLSEIDMQPLAAVEMQLPASPIAGVAYRGNGFLVLVDTDALATDVLAAQTA